ncbi:MAG: immunoglobulin domain-containing protein [Phycisphaerales bacterium]
MHAVSSAVLRLAAIALAASTGFAQTCVTAIPEGTVGTGISPSALFSPIVPAFATTWDPDGEGPLPTKLLVEQIGYGRQPSQSFPPGGSNDILMTDGTTFEIIPRPQGFELVSIGVYQNQLFVLGKQTSGSALRLFRREGDAWVPINLTVEMFYFSSGFSRLYMLETPNGLLIGNVQVVAADSYRCIVLDPSSGSISVTSLSGSTPQFAKVDDTVYAFGSFSINGTPSKIARLVNGEWESLDNVGGVSVFHVSGVAKYQGRLFASGSFQAPMQATTGLVELTPEGWQTTPTALPRVSSSLGLGLIATSQGLIAAADGRLYLIQNDAVVSQSDLTLDGLNFLAALDIVGILNDKVVVRTNALYEWGSPGPTFRDPQDTVMLHGIFLSDGTNNFNITPALNGSVFDLINFQGHTYALGQFKSANARSVRFVARRENGAWHPVDLTGGPQRRVNDATIWNGLLAVTWTRPQLTSVNVDSFVSTWDGTTWNTFPGPVGTITSLEASSTDLYCITSVRNGDFGLFRFDAGQWQQLISSRFFLGALSRVGDDVYLDTQKLIGNSIVPQVALETGDAGRPLVAESGRTIGVGRIPGQPPLRMYELRNGAWIRVSPGFTLMQFAASLSRGEEFLGVNPSLGFVDAFTITSWNGATWATRFTSRGGRVPAGGGGLNSGSINSLVVDEETGKLRFGSSLRSLMDASTDFTGLIDLKPRIGFSNVPLETRTQPGDTTTLRAQVISQGQFTYQWTRDNAALADGPLPTGEVITGATGPVLTITNSTAAVNGSYTLTVTPVDASLFCGPESTFPIPVTVERFCDSIDFNNNFVFPEDQDVVDFLTVFAGGVCSTAVCNDIDFNNNDIFPEDQDVIDFFNVLAGSTCP